VESGATSLRAVPKKEATMGITLKEPPRPESPRRASRQTLIDDKACTSNFRPARPTPQKIAPPVSQEDLIAIVGQLMPAEVQALHWVAAQGDVIMVAGKAYLLTPAPDWLLDVLAAVGAGTEDSEIDDESGFEDELEHQCEDEGAIETDGQITDDVEPYGWSPPTWPAEGLLQVPYHAQ
jgi:hypothetical protein